MVAFDHSMYYTVLCHRWHSHVLQPLRVRRYCLRVGYIAEMDYFSGWLLTPFTRDYPAVRRLCVRGGNPGNLKYKICIFYQIRRGCQPDRSFWWKYLSHVKVDEGALHVKSSPLCVCVCIALREGAFVGLCTVVSNSTLHPRHVDGYSAS